MVGTIGNLGTASDTGTIAAGGGGGGWAVLPDRVDLPFVTETEVRGEAATNDRISGIRFRGEQWTSRHWGADWWAWLALLEFGGTGWQARICASAPALDPARTASFPDEEDDLALMVRMAEEERADALGEILAQQPLYTDIMAPFTALLKISPASHPANFRLMHIAGLIGILVSLHFKNLFRRPRPCQLCPALMPPVPVPGHPSYPSGHATQAMLMALCLKEAQPGSKQAEMGKLLEALATRIARNREIAGLHYPSDSRAGRILATETFGILNSAPPPATPTLFLETLEKAQKEWTS